MEKKLRKAGASYSIVLPKTLLDLMQINPQRNLVKIDYEDGKIILTKGSTFEE